MIKLGTHDIGSCQHQLYYKNKKRGYRPSDRFEDEIRLKKIFELGHEGEEDAKKILRHRGYYIFGEQKEIEIEVIPGELKIIGHIDGLIENPQIFDMFETLLWEHKTVSPMSKATTVYDSWYAQVQIYMYGLQLQGHPITKCLFTKLDRDWRLKDPIVINYNEKFLEEFLENKVKGLYKCIIEDTLPDDPIPKEDWKCNGCRYNESCEALQLNVALTEYEREKKAEENIAKTMLLHKCYDKGIKICEKKIKKLSNQIIKKIRAIEKVKKLNKMTNAELKKQTVAEMDNELTDMVSQKNQSQLDLEAFKSYKKLATEKIEKEMEYVKTRRIVSPELGLQAYISTKLVVDGNIERIPDHIRKMIEVNQIKTTYDLDRLPEHLKEKYCKTIPVRSLTVKEYKG